MIHWVVKASLCFCFVDPFFFLNNGSTCMLFIAIKLPLYKPGSVEGMGGETRLCSMIGL